MLLAGDVGGTKVNLAVISADDGPLDIVKQARYESDKFESLEAIIEQFITDEDVGIEKACIGVAGPVVGGKAQITNLPWMIEEESLRETLDLEAAKLLNDLEATAYGVLALPDDDLHTISEGEYVEEGTIAVIAPGTGLGEGFLAWDGSAYRAHPSEGGHSDFGPLNDLQIDLLRYLLKDLDHVSYEWVCSGIGIPNLYRFLRDEGHADEPAWLADKLETAEDLTPIIADSAYRRDEPVELAVKTMELFVDILAAETGNLALKTLSTGGVYIGGGIPPRILPTLEERFEPAFLQKGRFNHVLEDMPVKVILNPETGLIGAARYVINLM